MSTDTAVEDASEPAELDKLTGYRRKWALRHAESEAGSGVGADLDLFAAPSEPDNLSSSKKQCVQFEPLASDIEIKDGDIDELVEEAKALADAAPRPSHPHAREALLNTDLNPFKYPWEKGRLRKIFCNDPLVKVTSPKLKPGGRNFVQLGIEIDSSGHVSAKTSVRDACPPDPIFVGVVKKIDDVPMMEDRDSQRRRAIEGWWNMLSFSLVASAIGSKVTVEATADTVLECAHNILSAVFAVKSPGTLLRRLYSIQAFELWCADNLKEHWLPVTELKAWRYVCHLKDSSAAPTKASSFIEALRFAWFLLGAEGAGEAECSLRVKGISAQMRAGKKPWRPADLLHVDAVLKLHALLADPSKPLGDRIFSGHVLHLLYSRSRWSDLNSVTDVYLDGDTQFLEAYTRCHKGGRSAEMKSRLLPLVAPARGVDSTNWAVIYMQLRKLANLELAPGAYGPMLPAPADEAATSWTSRPLTSEEGSCFLRKVLAAPKTAQRRLSTHSMKSTLMSWASKFGIPDNSRAVLARHVSSVSTATAVYSRDLLSPVLRQLDVMLASIRNGGFNPDRTRSGMMTPAATAAAAPMTPFVGHAPPAPVTPALRKDSPLCETPDVQGGDAAEALSECNWEMPFSPCDSVDGQGEPSRALSAQNEPDSDTSEEGSVQSSSSSEDESQAGMQRDFVFDPPSDFYINTRSLVVHCSRLPGVLKCGRKISMSFSKVYELSGIRCSRCFDV